MGVFDAVFTSAVRLTVLRELQAEPRQRRDLLDDVDASKSAVYNALNELRDHDLVREGRSRRWETTGLGDMVADYVTERQRAGDVLSTHADFWASHDPTVVPRPFRDSLGALHGCRHLTAPETEPLRVVSEVVDVIERASHVDLITPMYHDRYAAALERTANGATAGSTTGSTAGTSAGAGTGGGHGTVSAGAGEGASVRMVLARDVLREVEEREDADWDPDNPAVRVGDPEFSLLVTDETVLLTLPREDDAYDPSEKLRADSERARDWGTRLFEYYWRQTTPLESIPTIDG